MKMSYVCYLASKWLLKFILFLCWQSNVQQDEKIHNEAAVMK